MPGLGRTVQYPSPAQPLFSDNWPGEGQVFMTLRAWSKLDPPEEDLAQAQARVEHVFVRKISFTY